MNQDQVVALLTGFAKILGTWLAVKGFTSAAAAVTAPDIIQAVAGLITTGVSFWVSHAYNSTTPNVVTKLIPTVPEAVTKTVTVILLMGLIGIGTTGCTTTAQQATYETAGTTVVSVNTALSLWNAYVKTTKPPISQELAVRAAYEKYQATMLIVCDAGAAYSASGTNSVSLSNSLNQAIANAGQNLSDLENLITSFGVKLN